MAVSPQGTTLWNYPGGQSSDGSPAIDPNGNIIVCGHQGLMYSMSPNGTKNWQAYITQPPDPDFFDFFMPPMPEDLASPAIGPNGIIYTEGQSGIYGVNQNGQVVWTFNTAYGYSASPDQFSGTPVFNPDGTMFCVSHQGNVYCFNPSGGLKWVANTGYGSNDSLAMGPDGTLYYQSYHGQIVSVSQSGNVNWIVETGDGNGVSPGIDSNGIIYVGGWFGNINAIKPDGTIFWHTTVADNVNGSPSIGANGAIYIVGYQGHVYALNSDGTPQWSDSLPDQFHGSPAIAQNGVLYLAGHSGNLYSIGSGVPASLSGLTFTSNTFYGGSSTTGTVTLTEPAPTGGMVVTLTNQYPAYVSVPATVTIPAGSTSATFTVSTPQMYGIAFNNLVTATNGSNSYSVNLTVATYAFQSVTLSSPTIQAGSTGTGTLTIASPAPAGGWTVNLTCGNPTFVSIPTTVTIPEGQTSTTFTIAPTNTAPTFSCQISAHDTVIYHSATVQVTTDSVTGLSLSPTTIGAGGTSTATVTLKSPAPAGGWTIPITVALPWLVNIPTSVTVPAGATSATFPIVGKGTGKTYSTGVYLYDGHSGASSTVTVNGNLVNSLTLSPTAIGDNGTTTATVTLQNAAPDGGVVLNVSAGVPSVVHVPATVTVPAGQTSTTFIISAKEVGNTYNSGIYIGDGNSQASALLKVIGDTISSVTVNPTSIQGGNSVAGTVTLSSAAPLGGWLVQLKSGVPGTVMVPTSVLVPAGQTSVQFTINTKVVSSNMNIGVYASDGSSSANTTLAVNK